MNDLLKINFDSDRQTTSARSLWEFLDKPYEKFTKWFDQYKQYGFTENEDYRAMCIKFHTAQGNEVEAQDYEITIDMAKELSMLQKTEKGKQARTYFIDLEKKWNSPEAIFARALNMANKTIEDLKSDNLFLETKVKEQEPKVLFANSVSASNTSILVGDLAKLIQQNGIEIGEIRLWKWMRNNGYAIKEEGRSYNMPTQKSMDLKVMEVKEGTRISSAGESKITKTTMITGKGQQYFINKFLSKNNMQEVNNDNRRII